MKNDAFLRLRHLVAEWVVSKSDDLFSRSSFIRELLQRFPGFKFTFAKVWVDVWRTRLPHGWVDTLHQVPIHQIAVETDSDDPADFDGFNVWEQDVKRQTLDPDYVQPNSGQPKSAPTNNSKQPDLRFLFFNGGGAPTEKKSVRFKDEGLQDLHALAELATRRIDSPENWSVSDSGSSVGNGSIYELSPHEMAFVIDEDFRPLEQYAVRSNFIPGLDGQMNGDGSDDSGH